MQKYADVVMDPRGNVVRGAKVLVKTLAGAKATIYTNAARNPAPNPLTTDSLGRFSFYADNGRYSLDILIGSRLITSLTDILLEDPMDFSPENIQGGEVRGVSLNGVTIDGDKPVVAQELVPFDQRITDLETSTGGPSGLSHRVEVLEDEVGGPEGLSSKVAELKQFESDLSDPDKGAAMVARGVVAVDSIADLLALPEGQRKEGLRYLVKGYHAGSDIGGGDFYWDASSVDSINRGTVFGGAGVGRWKRVFSGSVDVSWFGAIGDGQTDCTLELQDAANAAGATSSTLSLSPGTYLVSDTLDISSGIDGNGAKLQFVSGVTLSSLLAPILRITGRGEFKNFALDGAASDDPNPLYEGYFNDYTGVGGINVAPGASGSRFENIVFTNVRNGGMKFYGAHDITVSNCSVNRSRGLFGDGFMCEASRNIKYLNCRAHDCNRIGFVADGRASGICEFIHYENCSASEMFGEQLSYGGGEYNAGFWAEYSNNISYISCTARDPGSFGFNVSPTDNLVDYESALVEMHFERCASFRAVQAGFTLRGRESIAGHYELKDCSDYDSGIGFSANRSSVLMERCKGFADGDSGGLKAPSNAHRPLISTGEDSSFTIIDFVDGWINKPHEHMEDSGSEAKVVGNFSSDFPNSVKIDGWVSLADDPLYVKVVLSAGSKGDWSFSNLKLYASPLRCSSTTVDNCEILRLKDASNLRCYRTVVRGEVGGIGRGIQRFYDCTFERTDQQVSSLQLISQSGYIASKISIDGCVFVGDLVSGVPFVSVNSTDDVRNIERAHDVFVNNCRFFNTGQGDSTVAAFSFIRAIASSKGFFYSVWKSPNLLQIAPSNRIAVGSQINDIG